MTSIFVVHLEGLPQGVFDDLLSSGRPSGIEVDVQQRPHSEAYAGLEWFLPTAVMIFIGKPYIEKPLKPEEERKIRDFLGKSKFSISKKISEIGESETVFKEGALISANEAISWIRRG